MHSFAIRVNEINIVTGGLGGEETSTRFIRGSLRDRAHIFHVAEALCIFLISD